MPVQQKNSLPPPNEWLTGGAMHRPVQPVLGYKPPVVIYLLLR